MCFIEYNFFNVTVKARRFFVLYNNDDNDNDDDNNVRSVRQYCAIFYFGKLPDFFYIIEG